MYFGGDGPVRLAGLHSPGRDRPASALASLQDNTADPRTRRTKRRLVPLALFALAMAPDPVLRADDLLGGLAKPHEGRSMRATSTFRQGRDGRYDPTASPKGDRDEASNRDNFRVAPGATHVLLDARGPGEITHIWLTFLGPEPQDWAKNGSANHQEMLLRIYWDGRHRPGVEAPVGDFFANCFGQRREVVSLPVVVDDGDSYNCFWRMPFRKSARIEIVNQSEKAINLLYYNIDWIKKPSCPKTRRTFTPSTVRNTRSRQAGLRLAGDQGERALRGHGAGRTNPQPGMVRRGGRENLS